MYEGPALQPGGASAPHVTLWDEPVAFGDLDGQPGDEVVVLVSASTGGSGSFVYVAAFGHRDGRLTPATAALVGDRVKVLALSIADRRVTLDIVEAGPGDPQCCPSRLARKTYALQGAALVPVAPAAAGSVSLADLAGTEWTLRSLDDRPIPPGARPPTLVFDGGTRVSGFGGCNRYTATIEEKTAGALTVGPLATSNMACATARDGDRESISRGAGQGVAVHDRRRPSAADPRGRWHPTTADVRATRSAVPRGSASLTRRPIERSRIHAGRASARERAV